MLQRLSKCYNDNKRKLEQSFNFWKDPQNFEDMDDRDRVYEDGPRPMKNYKPADKTKNGADKFWVDHQSAYEARGKQSDDRIERVHQHNRAYPKLYDELYKRRSTTRITANAKNHGTICSACLRLNKLRDLSKMDVHTKSRMSRKPGNRKQRHVNYKRVKSRVAKRRNYRRRTRPQVRLRRDDSDAQIPDVKNSKTKFRIDPNTKSIVHLYSKDTDNDRKDSKSGLDSKRDSSRGSMSSYSSYLSMDHEPMVSPEE